MRGESEKNMKYEENAEKKFVDEAFGEKGTRLRVDKGLAVSPDPIVNTGFPCL